MNKILLRVLLLLFASGVLLVILFFNRQPFGKRNSSFTSEPKEGITKIEFSEDGKKISLTKSGDSWLINGIAEARKSSILYIVRILQELKIKSPVSPDLFEKEVVEKNLMPVRVRVFEKRKLLKTFLVYKTSGNIYGNIMKIRAGGKPFIVYLPDYEGDIGSGFTANELFWQPNIVFNLLPSEISSVVFENFGDTASSFSLVNNLIAFIKENSYSDSANVRRYLSYFTRVPFEEWALDLTKEDKMLIVAQNPLYRITVTDSDGVETILTLWEKILPENNETDSDRLWGKIQSIDELFTLRYFDVDPLIKKRSYFLPQ